MKIHVFFGPSNDVSYFGTNMIKTNKIVELQNDPKVKQITYTLNDLPLTKKFLKHHEELRLFEIDKRKTEGRPTYGLMYHYNYYPPVNDQMCSIARQEMNTVIDDINKIGITISEDLKLSDTDSTAVEYDKTNKLHFIFEKNFVKLVRTEPDFAEKFTLLEKINHIVHYIERAHQLLHMESNDFALSIRPCTLAHEEIKTPLEDIDYENFVFPTAGDLSLDYSTIGKDLYSCYITNDLELIKKNEVKPQKFLTEFIFLQFDTLNNATKFNNFYKWCEQNEVDKYIDYKLPVHRPGRHILGRIDQPIYTYKDFYEQILQYTPNFLGYYVSQDNNPLFVSDTQ